MSENRNLSYRFFCIWILIAALLFPAPFSSASAEPPPLHGGNYRIPLASEPTTLDPAYYSDIYSFNVAHNLFDGLVDFDKDLHIVPAIARRWKISRDRRTYTFSLRRGVMFHNGREVIADDFIFSFARILNPDKKSPAAAQFLTIKGAKAFYEGKTPSISGLSAPTQHTLRIELEKPFAPFLSILAMLNAKVVPKESMGPDFARHPIGTGPFRFVSWKSGQKIHLKKNSNYFMGKPFLDNLTFKIYANLEWEKIFEDFEKGLLDQSIVPSSKYDLLSEGRPASSYILVSQPGLNLVYVGINATIKPFNDVRVRQAFNYAIHTEKIVQDITQRGSIPAKGILPPGIAGYDPQFEKYAYNPKKAGQLLASAGYPGGKGIGPVEIWTVSKSKSVQMELQAYKKYLAEVGIELIPKVAKDWKEFIKLINEKKVPLFYAAWYADYPDADNFLYVLCHSKSSTNRMGYSNPEVDKLLEQCREETDYMKRAKLYKDIQKQIMEDAPLICQHVNSFNYFFQPWVRGVQMSHLGAAYLPFREIWLNRM